MLSIAENLKRQFEEYKTAPLDKKAFHKLYSPCQLNECLGYCCYGGVGLEDEEVEALPKILKDHQQFFVSHNIDTSDPLVKDGKEDGYYTKIKKFQYPEGMLPKHFDHTTCIFRQDNGACSLQNLSAQLGHDSWWYKPSTCWLFPISLDLNGKPYISIGSFEEDDYVEDDFPGFTPYTKCGAQCTSGEGKPGYIVFKKEIETLSMFLERDLMKEILSEPL